VLARFDGCRTAKVKVAERGQTLADDVARVRAVRAAMGPEGRVRVDANGGWNVDEAEHAAHALAGFDLEYLEQPCASVDELAELRERLADWDLPIAADESVRKAADPSTLRAGAPPTCSSSRRSRSAGSRAPCRSSPTRAFRGRLQRPRHEHRPSDGCDLGGRAP
jgi:hypothetical protein